MPILKIDEYDSMYDMVRVCLDDSTTDCPPASRYSKSNYSGWGDDWVTSPTLQVACDRALYGWPEGLAEINRELVKVRSSLPGKGFKREPMYSMQGPGTISGSRLMQGHPKFMVKRVKVPTDDNDRPPGKNIRLYFNYAISASVGARSKFHAGARIVALIEQLEAAGNSCELNIVNGNYSYNRNGDSNEHHIITKVKGFGESLSMENIAFILCSSDMDRRLAFSLMEHWPREERKRMNVPEFGHYPGAMSWYPPEIADDPLCIKVDAQSTHDINPSTRKAYDGNPDLWLIGQLKKFGVDFVEESE